MEEQNQRSFKEGFTKGNEGGYERGYRIGCKEGYEDVYHVGRANTEVLQVRVEDTICSKLKLLQKVKLPELRPIVAPCNF